MIKLIAIDLDGTLLKDDKTISDRNKQALVQAKREGVKVVICTGRPLIAIEPILDRLELRDAGDYSITFNGGAIQKNDTGEEIFSDSLSLADVKETAELMTTLDLPLDVLSKDQCIHIPTATATHQSIYETLNPLLTFVHQTTASLTETQIFNKMVVGVAQSYLDQQISNIPNEFHAKFNIMKSRPNLLEILPKTVSKANGIQKLTDILGIKQSEVMALGDEENDESMIEYAGLGVVMENGNVELKKIAQYIAPSNEEDGVAVAVEKFVLKGEK
ncbi:haloacid dehalogenase [Vagococcus penaei]|uniref:Haloacid dehalogenase n=1 Tax=Vagococcus penaei TaxID=633807 RepID=A0A1Q2D6Y3_9ENTE|nr:Cof-type HAD-IIB family hydrolase [Vagococcus penaei]AQP54080.1 haloacid dehalogenase [Vagococcus penaei]RST98488.1 haloacid dehalogenase [Vagococcus penaei]